MLSTVLKTCLDDDNCDGITFEHGKDVGYGCFKLCAPEEDTYGYETGELDFYSKTQTGRIPL